MRRILVTLVFFAVPYVAALADIQPMRDGKSLVVDFYYPENRPDLFQSDSTLSWEAVEKDIVSALELARSLKCNAILIRDNKGGFLKIFKGAENLNLEHIKGVIDGMGRTEYVPGEVTGEKAVQRKGARYRQDTYKNGKLQSSYESDWTCGWFAPTTSTYRSGSDIYETRTYYQPPSKETVETRAPGKAIWIEGHAVFVRQVYRK